MGLTVAHQSSNNEGLVEVMDVTELLPDITSVDKRWRQTIKGTGKGIMSFTHSRESQILL